jgi:hypothetical protein
MDTRAIIYNTTNLVLQITLIITFVSVFFFVYGTQIEKDIVVSQINDLISNFTTDFGLMLSPDQKIALNNVFQNLQPPDMTAQDEQVSISNNNLIQKTIIIISTVFGLGIIFVISMCVVLKLPVWNILKSSFFGLSAVVLVEVCFLVFFVRNYRSLDPNTVKLKIVQTLQEYANS